MDTNLLLSNLMKTNTEQNDAQQCAIGYAEEIVKLHAEWIAAEDQQERDALRDTIITRVLEMPLIVDVRSGWHAVGQELEASEFQILLATGGLAVRIWGYLDRHCEPDSESIRLEFQDWGTPWTRFSFTGAQIDFEKGYEALLWFAQQFVYSGD